MKTLKIGNLLAKVPIVQGGMGVGISLWGLASAVANEGGVGVISSAGLGLIYKDKAKSVAEAAIEGLTRPDGTRPLLIAVTQLTSTDQERMENDLLIKEPIDKVVMHYASNAAKAGLDGVVCSPLEAGKVHSTCGEKFLTVTPGVRFADGDIGDQKRVMTPAEAKKIGSDYIVVGRPITAADDPVAAYERCVAEFVD